MRIKQLIKIRGYAGTILIPAFLFWVSSSALAQEVCQIVQKDSTLADTITIIGVGDMMLGTTFPSSKYLAPNDGKDLLTPLKEILLNADVTFGNSEGVFLNKGGTVKQCDDTTHCYAFREPTRYAEYLCEAGFDVVSVANNHVGDFGEEGRKSTSKTLDSVGLYYGGLLIHPYATFEINGVKYGFTAFAPNTGTNDLDNLDSAKRIVAHLDSISDIVIVSFHGGAEGAAYTAVPRAAETFYGESRGNVYLFAHTVVDAGADIVFGQGPHVTRAMELYKNRIIAYSLGNFCTYSRFNLKGPNGYAPLLKVKVNQHGEFLAGEIIPIKQEGEGGPVIDPEKKAICQLIDLNKQDFPESPLEISDEGQMKIGLPKN